MWKSKPMVFGAVLVVAGLIGLLGYQYWKGTPEYAFLQIKKAIEEHDKERFSEFVDIDSVISRGVDQFIKFSMADEELADNPFAGLAQGFAEVMKPKLIEIGRAQIDKAIEAAPSMPASLDNAKQEGGNGFDANEVMAKIRESGRIAWKKTEGKLTTVALAFTHEKYGSEHEIHLLMRKHEGHQRLIEISNLAAFLKEIEESERNWKREQNRPVQAKLDEALTLGSMTARRNTGRYGWDHILELNFDLTSSKQPLSALSGALIFKDSNDAYAFEIPIEIEDSIRTGQATTFTWRKDLNMFIDDQKLMWEASYDRLAPSIRLTSYSTEGGEVVALPYPDVR